MDLLEREVFEQEYGTAAQAVLYDKHGIERDFASFQGVRVFRLPGVRPKNPFGEYFGNLLARQGTEQNEINLVLDDGTILYDIVPPGETVLHGVFRNREQVLGPEVRLATLVFVESGYNNVTDSNGKRIERPDWRAIIYPCPEDFIIHEHIENALVGARKRLLKESKEKRLPDGTTALGRGISTTLGIMAIIGEFMESNDYRK